MNNSNLSISIGFLFFIGFIYFSCKKSGTVMEETRVKTTSSWHLGPFEKVDTVNPCLLPSSELVFECPIRKTIVRWEEKDVFNPAVVVKDNQVFMIYRAEDSLGIYNGTSRLGLAISKDGYHFQKHPKPILFPSDDLMKRYEWEGGVEDPRVVESVDGLYIMTYTSYDGKTARLCIASSRDLIHWIKHGLAFQSAYNGKHKDTWSKSGAIVCKRLGDKLIAKKVLGRYWMYWGDSDIYLATSDDLIHWEPLEEKKKLKVIMSYRSGYFDSGLVEPGPPALWTEKGIILIYNGNNYGPNMDNNIEKGTYSGGQALFDSEDPSNLLDRLERNFIRPDKEYEINGQVSKVIFLQGLAPFRGKWLLYYGTADSKIAVAESVE